MLFFEVAVGMIGFAVFLIIAMSMDVFFDGIKARISRSYSQRRAEQVRKAQLANCEES